MWAADEASRVAVVAVTDHFWVRASVDGRLTDFDPSTRTADVGQHLAEPTETLDPGNLDESLYQHVEFRLVAESLDGASLRASDVLKAQVRATELFGKNIRFSVSPQSFETAEATCRAVLLVGEQRFDGEPFALRGSATPASSGGPDTGAGDLFGGLTGDEDGVRPSAAAPASSNTGTAVLVRVSLVTTSRGPHLRDASYRRTLMDRLDRTDPPKVLAPLADDGAVRALLLQAWDGAASAGANHPAFVLQTLLASLKSQEPMEEKARARIYLGQPFGVDDLAPPMLPRELTGYYLSSDVNRHLASRQHGRHVCWYYERPRLAFARHGFVVGDWANPGGGASFADGIDLLNSPFRFLGGAEAASVARESGIVDTVLERSFARGGPESNTIPLFAAANEQGIATLHVDAAHAKQLDTVAVPAPIRRVLDEELASGQSLVLPSRLVSLHGVRTFGWWSVDTATGVAIGKMELGGSQGLVEVSKMHERVEKWTEMFAKFYGGLLRCYIDSLAENLGATPEALKTFSLKHGSGPGDSPMPGMDKLAGCVISQVCDMIAELLIEASVTPAFAKEAEATIKPLQKIILEWVGEQALEKAKGTLQGAVAKACEASMGGGEGGGK